jgi:MFS family permease
VSAATTADTGGPRARWGLALLVLLALYTAMDRQVIGLLAGPLQRDLGMDDTQFGLLQGAGVVMFAAVAGYPVAWLADRTDRRPVLAVCLALWCLALVGCSLASEFGELFVVSSLMGAAEAGVIPIAYALIADWFCARQRAAATSVFVIMGRLGAGLMIVASGWLVSSADGLRPWLPQPWTAAPDWSVALFLTALPGLLVAPALLSMPRSYRRAASRTAPSRPSGWLGDSSVPELLQPVASEPKQAIWTLMVGMTFLAAGAGALGVFMPVLVQRLGGLPASEAGAGLGAATLFAAVMALAISNVLAWRARGAAAGAIGMGTAALGMLLSSVCVGALAQVATHTHALVLYAGALGGTMTAAILTVGILQARAPTAARARFMALFVGAAAMAASLSPIAVGALSDMLGASPEALAGAIATVGSPCFLIAALVLAWGARR